ncbi:hypothetical protein NQ318_022593 [Aromia moschata]|uniref:NADH dehydrogenase [ubiquinone] 1 beta subcomplex subunit 9 n=1 Tax=Aromia moschata TaxID=1265417 RepID=A0AAV8XXN7_9CUCU|nr:hypothetical protein NQ318_022593 [Aromia moschata]
MSNLPVGLVSHTRKVQSLYKKSLRLLESWYDRRDVYRYQAVLMRQRFEENRCVKDTRIAKELIQQGRKSCFKVNTGIRDNVVYNNIPNSPGGVAYEREVVPPDWVDRLLASFRKKHSILNILPVANRGKGNTLNYGRKNMENQHLLLTIEWLSCL